MKKITFLLFAFFLSWQINAQLFQVTTCSGGISSNTYGPMNSVATANATSRVATIYPASQLTTIAGQTLNAVYFKRMAATGSMGGSPTFKVYLKEIAAADFGSSGLDWATEIATATLVYDSNPSAAVGSSAGWKSFSFSTNFVYSGTQNLVVLMEYVNTAASTAIGWDYEYGSPCISTGNSNTTKYVNNASGTPGATLSTSNYRRPQIGFDYVVACPAPTSFGYDNLTATTVDIDWLAGGAETSWEYVIQPTADPVPTSGTTIGTNSVVGATVSPNTPYTAYVRANCLGDGYSVWRTVSFTTPCATSSVPYLQDFATFVPACWTLADNGDLVGGPATIGTGGWVADGFGNVGTTGAVRINLDATGDNDWILSPMFAIPATGYELKFDASANQWANTSAPTTPWEADDFVQVLVSTGTTNWTVLYTYDNTNVPSNTGSTNVIDLDAYAGQNVRFAFRGVEGASNGGADIEFIVDNFELRESPTTPPVCATNLVATPNVCGNFANTLTWDATPAADWYQVTIGTTSGGNDIADNVTVSANSYSFSGTVNTQYFWSVVPYNGAGPAVGCAEQSFTTASTGCYCTSNPTSNTLQGITNVQIGTTDFSTGDVTYFDHSATVVDMAQGINNNVQISFATGATYDTNIWIDFNDNYVFEASEQVFDGVSLATNPTTLDASFIMPATAPLGQHMMRIGTADTGQATPNPCYSGSSGVTLDFAVNVVAAVCAPPAFTSSINADCANNLYYVDVNVTDTGDGTPYISDGIDVWPIAGTGITQAGPFANGASVTLTVYHGNDATCDLLIGNFAYTCPPVNDECATAIALTVNADLACGVVTAGSNVAATASSQADEGSGTPNRDVWFSFVATGTAHQISLSNVVAVVGTSVDMAMAVYNGAGGCGSLVYVGSSDPNTYYVSGLTAGNTYYVRVYGFSVAQATFNICVGTPPAPPANDECSAAVALTVNADLLCGVVTPGTNVSASMSSQTDDGVGTPNNDVWFSFVATSATHQISLTNVVAVIGTSVDMAMAVYNGTGGCGSLVYVGSSDPNTYNVTGLTAGVTYYVRVYGYSVAQTNFNICVGTPLPPPPPPANDACSNAIVLIPGGVFGDNDVVGTNASATVEPGHPLPACENLNFATNGKDVWYTVTVPASGSITVETNNNADSGMTDSGLEVYSGTCGALTSIECDTDDSADGLFSIVSLTGRTPGETLLVRVWGYNTNMGSFRVSAYDASLSTGSFDAASLKAYPNPVTDVLNLSYSSEISSVEVYNMLGQVVMTKTLNATQGQVDMTALTSGSYIVKITSNGLTKSMKVLKK